MYYYENKKNKVKIKKYLVKKKLKKKKKRIIKTLPTLFSCYQHKIGYLFCVIYIDL